MASTFTFFVPFDLQVAIGVDVDDDILRRLFLQLLSVSQWVLSHRSIGVLDHEFALLLLLAVRTRGALLLIPRVASPGRPLMVLLPDGLVDVFVDVLIRLLLVLHVLAFERLREGFELLCGVVLGRMDLLSFLQGRTEDLVTVLVENFHLVKYLHRLSDSHLQRSVVVTDPPLSEAIVAILTHLKLGVGELKLSLAGLTQLHRNLAQGSVCCNAGTVVPPGFAFNKWVVLVGQPVVVVM